MIAVLEEERQALAALDLDGLVAASRGKLAMCERIEACEPDGLGDDHRGLLETARQLNEINRRVRNLLAANVSARLDALSGGAGTYQLARAVNY
ncbi:hypothetical protein GRI94_16075 [Erythrobacter jejuensis]|uniref:Flagellar protein FlgN n=2 Tax=Parerythrobacter jejuensis TaxID=795812 RepID=A0A845AMD5_9SPHN|nr:hypothetical protein [Parerythrobacter jejuensis]MXP33347.1 hypothetical protein [Parerythrobacter jejuensis]